MNKLWMKPSSAPDDFHEGNASARQDKTPIGRQKKKAHRDHARLDGPRSNNRHMSQSLIQ